MEEAEIIEMWDEDKVITEVNIEHILLSMPFLHFKYYKILMQYNKSITDLELKHKILYKNKREYYIHGLVDKPTKEEIKKFPKGGVLKSDVDIYINADEEFQTSIRKIADQKEVVKLLEEICTSIKNRTFIINEFNKRKAFLSGS